LIIGLSFFLSYITSELISDKLNTRHAENNIGVADPLVYCLTILFLKTISLITTSATAAAFVITKDVFYPNLTAVLCIPLFITASLNPPKEIRYVLFDAK